MSQSGAPQDNPASQGASSSVTTHSQVQPGGPLSIGQMHPSNSPSRATLSGLYDESSTHVQPMNFGNGFTTNITNIYHGVTPPPAHSLSPGPWNGFSPPTPGMIRPLSPPVKESYFYDETYQEVSSQLDERLTQAIGSFLKTGDSRLAPGGPLQPRTDGASGSGSSNRN